MEINHKFIDVDIAKKQQEKVINELRNNEDIKTWLKKYQLNEDFIGDNCYLFVQYLDILNKCKSCNGLDECIYKDAGKVLVLVHNGGLTDFEQRDCKYLIKHNNRFAHKNSFVYSDMSDAQYEISFDKIDFLNESDEYLMLIEDIKQVFKSNSSKGLYLYGPPGVGKTFLACCIINEVAKLNETCAFVCLPSFIGELKNGFASGELNQKTLRKVKRAKVLVIDDIGGEKISVWSRDEILFGILNYRMEHNLLTIFTSNYSTASLQERYVLGKGELDAVGALRLMERMKSLSIEKIVNGVSRR